MSARRSTRSKPGPPRRSLRLENRKQPFSFQRLTTSIVADSTPRALFKKVLQTQPIVSPLVPEKPRSPRPVEPVSQLPLGHTPCSNLEISLPESASKPKSHISRLKPVLKKVCLSEFERGVNNQLDSTTAQSSLENISLTKSLQISFRTPAPLQSAGKKGLIRRPKNYRGINVKDFEGGIEENLLHGKESQSYLMDSQTAALLSDTETRTASTKLFAQPQLSGQNGEEVSDAHSQHALIQQSLTGECMLPSNQTPRQGAKSNREIEGMESAQKELFTPESESMDGADVVLKKKADSLAEEQQESLQDTSERFLYSIQKKRLTQGSDDAGRMEAVLQESRAAPENVIRNSCTAQLFSPEKQLSTATEISQRIRAETPDSCEIRKSTKELERPPTKEMIDRITQPTGKGGEHQEMLDMETEHNMIPEAEMDPESEEMLDAETDIENTVAEISQRIRAETPGSCEIRKSTKELERPPTKEMIDRITQPTGKGGEHQEMLDMEMGHNMIAEAEMDPDSEEMSGADTDFENTEPTGKTPAFVHARAFQCTPLLATPHTFKVTASRSPPKQCSVKRAPKPFERARRTKHEPSLPSSLIKKLFSHYVGMPVAKDAFKAVERCVNLYFKHLSDDLEAYTNHARRKTAEPADMELLMRRQGLITDKTPLNVLIERHLPLAYRKLLIPVAISGNKVVPPKLH